jgi:hypothetical protein
MVRPRKLLPAPCPCGEKYGTFQMVLFNNKYSGSNDHLILRIRHYSSKHYAGIRDRKKNNVISGLYRKRWHSFRVSNDSLGSVSVNGEDVPLRDYFVKKGQTYLKSKTVKVDSAVIEYVRKYGWDFFMPDESQFYKRHQPKLE